MSIPSDPLFPDSMTLGDARAKLRELVKKGHRCPCCTQNAQVYRWTLYSTAARALILFLRLGGTTEFVHSNRVKELGSKGQGDAARLRMWGLVEEEKVRRPDGGRSGFWRVTELGERFARNEATIQKYGYVYDKRVLGHSGPQVTIIDCLGKNFNYREMMEGLG